MKGREKRERGGDGGEGKYIQRERRSEGKNGRRNYVYALTTLAYTVVQLHISEQMHQQLPEYLVEKQVEYYHLFLAVEICSF